MSLITRFVVKFSLRLRVITNRASLTLSEYLTTANVFNDNAHDNAFSLSDNGLFLLLCPHMEPEATSPLGLAILIFDGLFDG
jgi:hypothetical protein